MTREARGNPYLQRIHDWPSPGRSVLTGRSKVRPEDFVVDELPLAAPSGAGEFSLLRIEKRDLNTAAVAARLAGFCGVRARDVSYAGRKDRRAVTRQWFSVHLPGRPDPRWEELADDGLRILESHRHHRKLRRGALAGNRFDLRLRDVDGDRQAIEARLATVGRDGVPNYFGPQRFGRNASNLLAARGSRRDRRSLQLSAARSFLFNEVLAVRVAGESWYRGLPGEVWMLRSSRAIFGPEDDDPTLPERCAAGEIDPTGPLWGRGELRSRGRCRELEADAVARWPELMARLEKAGLGQERRRLRLAPGQWEWSWEGRDSLRLHFTLERGAFATAVLAAVGDVT